MKKYDDIIRRFDDIQDLPVSEELLGAYLEKNVSNSELATLEFYIEENPIISDIIEDADDIQISPENLDIDNIEILDDQVMQGLSEWANFGTAMHRNDENVFLSDVLEMSEHHELENESINKISIMSTNSFSDLESSAADRIFGEGGNGNSPVFDPMIYQGPEGVCAIRSQQIILRDYGIDIPLEDLKQYAIQNGWYDPSDGGGTPVGYVGALLDACGVGVRQDANCTVYDIVNELAQGHRVIVGVDANELWADREGNIKEQISEFFKDITNEEANHALVVAGVDVNPNDPDDVKVILTDPGTGDLRIEYTLNEFMDAWEDSNCFMTTTTTPAPFQYDAEHSCMVPSNFAVNQFVDANSLPLNADVRIPEEYLASAAHYTEGHLDIVGHDKDGNEISYDEYSSRLAECKQMFKVQGSFGQDHFDRDSFVSAFKQMIGIDPEPVPEPVPEPDPEPVPEPDPEPDPEPVPEPDPDPSSDDDGDNDADDSDDEMTIY